MARFKLGRFPCRSEWQPTPVLLPGESHGLRSLAGYSPWGCKESDKTERLTPLKCVTTQSDESSLTIPSRIVSPLLITSPCVFPSQHLTQLAINLSFVYCSSALPQHRLSAVVTSSFPEHEPGPAPWKAFSKYVLNELIQKDKAGSNCVATYGEI